MRRLLALGLILFLLGACGSPENVTITPVRSLEVYKPENAPGKVLNVGFLAINGVYNSELMAPFDIFQHTIFHDSLGMKTFIVSPTKEVITTFEGIRLLPDYDFNDVPDIDVLVVPSAEHNMDTDLEDETLINFVREKGQKARYIMSLCDGAFILAQAGLLNDVQCTTFPSDIERFKQTFPQLDVKEGISFVRDGKAITSAGGAKSYDPAMFLVEFLYGKKVADGVAAGLVIDWNLGAVPSIILE